MAESGGLLNRPGSDEPLANRAEFRCFPPTPPKYDSVLTCPDLPFVDTITAQFAAPAAWAGARVSRHTSRGPVITEVPPPGKWWDLAARRIGHEDVVFRRRSI